MSSNPVTLLPIRYPFCGGELLHGERGDDVDPAHPYACFCGIPDYMACPDYLDDGGFMGWEFHPAPPRLVEASDEL